MASNSELDIIGLLTSGEFALDPQAAAGFAKAVSGVMDGAGGPLTSIGNAYAVLEECKSGSEDTIEARRSGEMASLDHAGHRDDLLSRGKELLQRVEGMDISDAFADVLSEVKDRVADVEAELGKKPEEAEGEAAPSVEQEPVKIDLSGAGGQSAGAESTSGAGGQEPVPLEEVLASLKEEVDADERQLIQQLQHKIKSVTQV